MMAIVTALWHLKRKPQIPMATRKHFLCCLFWDPIPPNRELKGRLEGTFSYLKEYPTFWLSFSIEILVQVPHLNFFWWLSL